MARQRFQWSRRGIRSAVVILAIVVACALLGGFLQLQERNALYPSGPLHAIESLAQDSALRTRSPDQYGTSVGRNPRDLITIVAIDEHTLAELGLIRTWPRTYYAQVVDRLLAAPPRVIVFDVGFFEPSPEDEQFAAALDRARALRPPTAVGLAAVGGGQPRREDGGDIAYSGGLMPVGGLQAVAGVGTANVFPDDRGVVRSMPLLNTIDGTQYPSLGLIGAARYLRRPGN